MQPDTFTQITGVPYVIVDTRSRGPVLVTVNVTTQRITVYKRTSLAGQRPRYDEPVAEIDDEHIRSYRDVVTAAHVTA